MRLLEPTGRVQIELVVRKSRFIGLGIPATTPQGADSELRHIKEQHNSANHVVHAYLVGAPEREIGSLTDAGEPRGTAGRPVMEILRGSAVRNVLIAVVRYFGGTKLGTGGLVRAYGDAARMVLGELPTRPLLVRGRLTVVIDYQRHEPVRRALLEAGVEILSEGFGTTVQLELSVEREMMETVIQTVRDLSAGTAEIQAHTP